MSTKLFVGNLSFGATQEQLQGLFGAHGTVVEVDIIKDKFTDRPRGFGFVTMESQEAAEAAIKALNGKELDGRALTVNVARPREERSPRFGGPDPRTPRVAAPGRQRGSYLSLRKFWRIWRPLSVRMLSGWNCTPQMGNCLCRTPMISPSSVSAVTSRQSGRLLRSMTSEW